MISPRNNLMFLLFIFPSILSNIEFVTLKDKEGTFRSSTNNTVVFFADVSSYESGDYINMKATTNDNINLFSTSFLSSPTPKAYENEVTQLIEALYEKDKSNSKTIYHFKQVIRNGTLKYMAIKVDAVNYFTNGINIEVKDASNSKIILIISGILVFLAIVLIIVISILFCSQKKTDDVIINANKDNIKIENEIKNIQSKYNDVVSKGHLQSQSSNIHVLDNDIKKCQNFDV
jgi:hypothetical protein